MLLKDDSYESGMSAFNKFHKNYNLDVIWPPPVNHISSFIAFLAYNSYTPSTAKTYVSTLSFSLKCKGSQNTTQHFIAKQMLKGINFISLFRIIFSDSFELVQANYPTLSKAEKAREKADMNMTASYKQINMGNLVCYRLMIIFYHLAHILH
jgi:hypothetical protein